MKVTLENLNTLHIDVKERNLLGALILDLMEINNIASNSNQEYKKLYIDWQDFHNEYSPEWTDPCPDYYGYYTLRFEKNPSEICGIEMTLDDLDMVLCTLNNYVDFLGDFKI